MGYDLLGKISIVERVLRAVGFVEVACWHAGMRSPEKKMNWDEGFNIIGR